MRKTGIAEDKMTQEKIVDLTQCRVLAILGHLGRLNINVRKSTTRAEKTHTGPLQAQTGLLNSNRKSTAENRAFSVEIISSFSGGEPAG